MKAAHQIHVTIQIGVLDLAIAWGERLIQHGITENGCRTATLEQDVAWLKQIAGKARTSTRETNTAKELRGLRDLVRASRDGFLNGQPYILTYTDIAEHLTELLGEQVWPCPDCDSLGTDHAPNCKRLAAAPAEADKRSQLLSEEQVLKVLLKHKVRIPDTVSHDYLLPDSIDLREITEALNAALAVPPMSIAAEKETK